MNATDITFAMKVNVTPMIRAMHDATRAFGNMTADMAGRPRPPRKPYPKRHSGMTARQYRAARRRYARERRGYAKAMQTWTPRPPTSRAWAAFAEFATAARRAERETP